MRIIADRNNYWAQNTFRFLVLAGNINRHQASFYVPDLEDEEK